MGNDVHLHMDQDVELVRRYSGPGEVNALIRNKGFTTTTRAGNLNLKISGGTLKSYCYDAAYKGSLLGFVNVQWLTIDDVRITEVYKAWNASFLDCQDVTITRLFIDSGTELEEDGVHFAGGARIVLSDFDIRCGDDAIALVQDDLTAEGGLSATTDLVGFTASNGYLHSAAANAVKVAVRDDINQKIRDVRFSNIVAKTGGRGTTGTNNSSGIEIVNERAHGHLQQVAIVGMTLDARENTLRTLKIENAVDCQLTDVVIDQPLQRATIEGSHYIELTNLSILNPRGTGQDCLAVAQSLICNKRRNLSGGQGARHLAGRQRRRFGLRLPDCGHPR